MEEAVSPVSDAKRIDQQPSAMRDDDRIKTLDEWFKDAFDSEQEFLKQAWEDEQFYLGSQWDAQDIERLEDEGRPHLTYNYIASIVNVVNGYHRQNKQDVKVFNRRGGSRQMAEILTAILKHTKQTKNGDWEVAYAHLMGCITGKSYIGIDIDYDEDVMNGELFYGFNSCFDVLVDPFGSRYDLTDRDFMFKSVWTPKSKIQRLYPGKVKEGFAALDKDRMSFNHDVETFNYADAQEYHDQSDDDTKKYRYRVKECWWKEYRNMKFLVNVTSGKVHNVTSMADQAIKRIMGLQEGLAYVRRTKPVMHMMQYVGMTELVHVERPMGGMNNFPLVPFYPYFVRGKHQGVITQLKDPQREHNKRLSQALHHLNTSANSGYIADPDATDNWEELEANISKPGYIKKIKKGARFERDQPVQMSQGHVALATGGEVAIKKISGVNSDLLGERQEETISGVAIARRQAQGLMATEIIHDNMKLTLKILGDRSVEAIQKSGAYSREEVLRLVLDGNEQEFEINQKQQATERIMNDMSIGRYEAVVDTTINTPTARFARYAQLLDAIKTGVPIPPEILIEESDMPQKEKVIESIKQAQQAQQQAAQGEREENEKDRQIKLAEIRLKTKGDMLRDAQKAQLDMVKEADKEPKERKGSR